MAQSQQNPETPAPAVGQKCPNGHDYAQRSEIIGGKLKMVAFCPSCEGSGLLPAPTAAK